MMITITLEGSSWREILDEIAIIQKAAGCPRIEAKAEDARRLLEDGVAVTPLPFMPPRKTN